MTEILFLDLDDTILDFHKAERIALAKTLESFGVAPEDEVSWTSPLTSPLHSAFTGITYLPPRMVTRFS